MKYFLVLAEEGSISAAAQRLFVTQQAFSEQMKRLEAACGTVLFIRKPRFALTPAGEALLANLREVRILEQGLDAQLREIREKGVGHLRMGIHSTRARVLLPRVLERFRAVYPHVELTFCHNDTRELEKRLLGGDLDLFFGVDARELPEFQSIQLAKEPIRLAVSRELLCRQSGWDGTNPPAALTPTQLGRLDLILSPSHSNFQAKVDEFLRKQRITPRTVITIPDFEIQLQMAARGLGACFYPRMMLPKLTELNAGPGGACLISLPVQSLVQTSRLALVLHRRTYRSEYLRFLLDLLKEEFARCYQETEP